MIRVQVEHLRPGAQAEAETVDHGRALQPAAAGCAGDHVALAVDGADVHGVAPHLTDSLRARPGPVTLGDSLPRRPRQSRLHAARRPWTQLEGCAVTHELATPTA